MPFVKVSTIGEIPKGKAGLVEAAGKKMALFNLDGQFYAIDNNCTHQGGPLAEGEVEGETVICPWHGAVFKITTGEVVDLPAPKGVASYNVRIQGSDIEVEV